MALAGGRFKLDRGDKTLGPRATKWQPIGDTQDREDIDRGWCPRARCEWFEDFMGAGSSATLSEPMFSAGGAANQIAVGTGTTTVATFRVLRSGVLSGARMVAEDALAANDTNFLTFTLVNNGQDGTGTTAMLAATDANTTKATGGTGITAETGRSFTLHGTAANLRVAEGDILTLTATVSGTLANVVDFPVGILSFSTLPDTVSARTTKTVGLVSAAPVANAAHGQALFGLGAVDEINVTGFDWGDQLSIPATSRPIFQIRMKFSGVAAVTRAVWGLASAYNATFDTVSHNAWFRWEGNSLNLLAEVDDDTTNTDDQDTGFDLVADTFYLFTIDMSFPGQARFSVDDTPFLELTSAAAFVAADMLQPVVYLQKDSGVGAGTMTVDYAYVTWDRGA